MEWLQEITSRIRGIKPVGYSDNGYESRFAVYLNTPFPLRVDQPDPLTVRRLVASKIHRLNLNAFFDNVFKGFEARNFSGIAIRKAGIRSVAKWEDVEVYITRDAHLPLLRLIQELQGDDYSGARVEYYLKYLKEKRTGKRMFIATIKNGEDMSIISDQRPPTKIELEAILRRTGVPYYLNFNGGESNERLLANRYLP